MKGTHKGRSILFAATFAAVMAVLAGPGAALTEEEIRKQPGYVEFKALDALKGTEAKVEVYLKDPMLNLVAKFIKTEDAELYDILSNLHLVRVQIYDVDKTISEQLSSVTSTTVKELDTKGWERIVRVRDGGDNVDVYLKPSSEYDWLDGIVVMVNDGDEAVFVNVVGRIKPEDIARLGEHFDIDELEFDTDELKKHKKPGN